MVSTGCNKLRKRRKTHQPFPWILVEKPQRHVKSGAAPALQTVRRAKRVTGEWCNRRQVLGADARCEKRLLSISPGRIRD